MLIVEKASNINLKTINSRRGEKLKQKVIIDLDFLEQYLHNNNINTDYCLNYSDKNHIG